MSSTKYDYGKPANKRDMQAAQKAIGKMESKPSVTAIAREYMAKGFDDQSVYDLLKACKIKHSKDLKGIASLRRALARAGDLNIEVKGASKKKSAKKAAPAKKSAPAKGVAAKKGASKKAAAKKPAPKKHKRPTTTDAEDEDPLA